MTALWVPPGPDPLLTHRVESWRVDVLARDDSPLGELTGVTGGTVEHNINRVIHGGGRLDVDDLAQVPDWLDLRVRTWWQVEGMGPWPLGTFLCSAPSEQHKATGRAWSIELLDKLTILDEDKVDGTYALPAGTVVTTAVRAVILASGETAVAITDSAETLTAAMVWEAGTSRLRIVNDLLAAINFFALRTDLHGRFVAAPYVAPGDRATVRDLTGDAIVVEEWTRDQDLASVPNRVVLVGRGSGDTEALVGVAENTDPANRLSIPSRGRVLTHTETGVESSSQAVIDALAARKLADLSAPAATRVIEHAPVPVGLHDVVAHEGVRGAIQSWSLDLSVGADMRTNLREVA
ncbi:MAG: hypothetical protein M0R37_15050 [Bacteroidales bacterium]|jgi:hypothetical protein|nr:hypothetical protein [Bacteroidales bacterium]